MRVPIPFDLPLDLEMFSRSLNFYSNTRLIAP